QRSSTASSGRLARFQRASGPTPMRNSAGVISGTNTASKYGGPTEILPAPSASSASGDSVPRDTVPAPAASSPLLGKKRDSLEKTENAPPSPMRDVRHAYSASAPPIKIMNRPKIKIPRFGSTANA